jgi:hypothetical protein
MSASHTGRYQLAAAVLTLILLRCGFLSRYSVISGERNSRWRVLEQNARLLAQTTFAEYSCVVDLDFAAVKPDPEDAPTVNDLDGWNGGR